MPFSEPTADGPLFVRANQESLSRGTNLDDYFTLMKRVVGECPMQVLMMGYCNTAFMIGFDQFPEMLKENGASGFIIPDLPVEEYGVLHQKSADCGIHPVMLCTPTNTPARLEKILSNASGFVYCVSRKGVTGKSTELNKETSDFLEQCREILTCHSPWVLDYHVLRISKCFMAKQRLQLLAPRCLDPGKKEAKANTESICSNSPQQETELEDQFPVI